MLAHTSRFTANERECAGKVIDGEAVIINLLNGTYYSLDNAGGKIWEMLAAGHSVDEAIRGVTAAFDVDADRARADVEKLVDELLAERLLVVSDATPAPAVEETPAVRARYETPGLVTYRDMSDLLALDPPMPRLEDIAWTDVGGSGTSTETK